jgi:hypothetical protein
MSFSPGFGGFAAGGGAFAPADFGDGADLQPLSVTFDVGGHGSSTPYTGAVTALLTKQMDEIKNKAHSSLVTSAGSWKKRLKEFLSSRNNELLDFMKMSLTAHPTLGPGDLILRKFGNPQVTPTHASVRDIVLDLSGGEDVMAGINEALLHLDLSGATPLKLHAAQTRHLFEEYRMAGDTVFTLQGALSAKLARLDKIQGRLGTLFEIDANEKLEPLMEATETYLKKVFEDNQIEENYKALVTAYRRFAVLREAVSLNRTIVAQEHEPMCSICLHDPVSFCFTPCGHTFCGTCARRQLTVCPFCRAAIKDRVKLYFC